MKDFGNAEVEQFDLSFRRDQRVRGLQVAMDDEILVCILNRVAHGREQDEPVPDAERLAIAVRRDGFACHVFHGEVRPAVGGDAAVEEARDVRVLKARENLALAEKAPQNLSAVRPAADQLECDLLFELAVGAIREEHTAHATVANLAYQPVRPDAIAGLVLLVGGVRGGRRDQPRGVHHRWSVEELRGVRVGGDESVHPRAEDGVAGARSIERLRAHRGLEVQHVVEDRLDSGPFLRGEVGRHDGSYPGS